MSLIYNGFEWVDNNKNSSLQKIEIRSKQLKSPKPKQKKSVDQIYAKLRSDELYGYAIRLYEHVNTSLKLEMSELPVFRNVKQSCYRPGSKQIIFGYESLNRAFQYGFDEYQTVKWVWDYKFFDGKQGVYQLVLHEIAHYINTEISGNKYDRPHNTSFQNDLKDLIEMFPYNNVKNI